MPHAHLCLHVCARSNADGEMLQQRHYLLQRVELQSLGIRLAASQKCTCSEVSSGGSSSDSFLRFWDERELVACKELIASLAAVAVTVCHLAVAGGAATGCTAGARKTGAAMLTSWCSSVTDAKRSHRQLRADAAISDAWRLLNDHQKL